MKKIIFSATLFVVSLFAFSNKANAQTITNGRFCTLYVAVTYGPPCSSTPVVYTVAGRSTFTPSPPVACPVLSYTITDAIGHTITISNNGPNGQWGPDFCNESAVSNIFYVGDGIDIEPID